MDRTAGNGSDGVGEVDLRCAVVQPSTRTDKTTIEA
jgi:hypothetical protein